MKPRRGLLVATLMLAAMGGGEMAMADPMVLCSAFEGRLVHQDGRPAAGIRIRRAWHWSWNDSRGSDTAITGKDGRFSFDEVVGRTLLGALLPHQPRILQTITAGDAESLIWRVQKPDYDRNGETLGRRIRVTCVFGAEPGRGGPAYGTCQFSDE